MRALYDSKSKLDDRGIKYLLSEENKYKTWLKVEGALALSQAKEGFMQRAQAESDLLKREVVNGRKCLLHLRSEHIKRDYSYTLCRKNCKKFFPTHDIILPKLSFFDNYTIPAKLSFVNNFSRY